MHHGCIACQSLQWNGIVQLWQQSASYHKWERLQDNKSADCNRLVQRAVLQQQREQREISTPQLLLQNEHKKQIKPHFYTSDVSFCYT